MLWEIGDATLIILKEMEGKNRDYGPPVALTMTPRSAVEIGDEETGVLDVAGLSRCQAVEDVIQSGT